MENEIEKKIKGLKEFIKEKTDQGTTNYLGEELRELCGMVETEALRIHDVVGQSEQFFAFTDWYFKKDKEIAEALRSEFEYWLKNKGK